MKLYTAFLFILIGFSSLSAQDKYIISGKVKDASTKKPLSNVNVYLANTMSGCVTDSLGNFRIQFSRSGNYELVASILGYGVEKKIIELSDENNIQENFSLSPIVYETADIGVTASVNNEWNDNFQTFKRVFLGRTEFVRECEIENKEEIDFKWVDSDVMTAGIQKPLRIVNKALGFRVDMILSKFEWNKKELTVYYVISPKFTLLKPEDDSEKERWEENRKIAYERSAECFFSSLINNDYWKKGYSVYWDESPFLASQQKADRVLRPEELLAAKKDIPDEYILSFGGYLKIEFGDRTSWIKLLYPEITLFKSGYTKELLAYKTYGYWSTLGIANLLPLDYKLE